jgi:CheY-like chemotaxis protein
LLVDDDEPVRVVIAASLRDMGYALREADRASAALEILQQDIGIDVLLTDLIMPGMSGVQLANAALWAIPRLAVVYLSGYAEAMDRQKQRRHAAWCANRPTRRNCRIRSKRPCWIRASRFGKPHPHLAAE